MFGFGTRLFTPLLCFINQLIVQLLLILILSNIFDILCGVRQGCPLYFLFLIAIITKYCSKSRIKRNFCFGRENNIS